MAIMTDFSIVSIAATASVEKLHDDSFKTIGILSCAGLLMSFCLMTFGVDLGAGWI
jgi:hypothetical protein